MHATFGGSALTADVI